MCGIHGWIGTFRRDPGLHHGCLAHRGPDEAGEFHDEQGGVRVAFGHRRLRIIDLSPEAAQPMATEAGLAIAYNGEVYNYRALREELEARGTKFRSASDTEVVLRGWEAWGRDVLGRLDGMFAFALWDRPAGELVLARDAVGIKPLYYAALPEGLVFASEIKALLATPGVDRTVDPDGLADYFTLGYTLGARTVYRGIRKLPPAHALAWRGGTVSVRRYWSPPAGEDRGRWPEQLERLEAALRGAVERQMVADVPVGAFLSGGVDSSLIAALMRRVGGGRVKTFCVGFEGLGLYDERPHARRVASLLGTEHAEEVIVPRPRDEIERIVAAFDEPFADSSAIPTYYLAEVTRREVTVALSGTGADDLLGGYRRYASHGLRRVLGRVPRGVRGALAGVAGLLPAGRRTRAEQAALFVRRALAASVADEATWYADLMTVLDGDVLRELAPSLALPERHPLAGRLAGDARGPAGRYLAADFTSYLPDDLLVKEDRMTMAHGLEGRVPFLDREVVELAWRLPDHVKVRGLQTKWLLKRLALRWLPRDIVLRPKHGFAVPVGEWFRGELRDLGRDVLLERAPGTLLSVPAVERLWEAHARREADLGPQLWALFVYRLWERRGTAVPAAGAGAR